jgi:hypothetical protein
MKYKRVHIGSIIKEEVKNQKKTFSSFAKSIGIQKQNVEKKVFRQSGLDTDFLIQISETLNCDFFKYYYPESGSNQKELQGEIKVFRSSNLLDLIGESGNLERVVFIEDTTSSGSEGGRTIKEIEADHLLIFFGTSPHGNKFEECGIKTNNHKIIVDHTSHATNLPGVYAVGDAAYYENKINLIVSGFGESTTAAYSVLRYLNQKTDIKNNIQSLKV